MNKRSGEDVLAYLVESHKKHTRGSIVIHITEYITLLGGIGLAEMASEIVDNAIHKMKTS